MTIESICWSWGIYRINSKYRIDQDIDMIKKMYRTYFIKIGKHKWAEVQEQY